MENVQLAFNFLLGSGLLYIAWQQWRTNEMRLRYEMVDRRKEIYDDLLNSAYLTLGQGYIGLDDNVRLKGKKHDVEMFFGELASEKAERIILYIENVMQEFGLAEEFNDLYEIPMYYIRENHKKLYDEMSNLSDAILEFKDVCFPYLRTERPSALRRLFNSTKSRLTMPKRRSS